MVKVKEGWIQTLRAAGKLVNEKIKKPLVVAEIGVADARNAVKMLEEMNIERIYLIDSYSNYADGPFTRNEPIQDWYYRRMFINIQPYLAKITSIKKDSIFAASLFKDGFFDFVYIDGCHQYPSVKKDMEAWWPKVVKGGIMGGHDIGHVDFPGVAKAVEEFAKKRNLPFSTGDGSDWMIEKV